MNADSHSAETKSVREDGVDPLTKNDGNSSLSRPIPFWIRVAPFFASGLFFMSGVFSVFAPLPLLFLAFSKGRKWSWLAFLSNAILVAWGTDPFRLSFYCVFVGSLALVLPEILWRKKSVELSVASTLAAMMGAALLGIVLYSQMHHLNPLVELQRQISEFVDYLVKSISTSPQLMNPGDLEAWKSELVIEFPSAVAIFSLILIWANLVAVLKLNPGKIREKLKISPQFFRSWKTPEWMVWPTIVSGFFLIYEVNIVSDIALNLFRFLMAIYALQGLSVLSYFFDLWGIRRVFRMVGFSLALFLMMPLILSLGFFDLWFDFRGKFRQS